MPHLLTRLLAVAGLAGAVPGCAVGPDYRRPDAPASSAYDSADNRTLSTGSPGPIDQQVVVEHKDISGQWWDLIKSKPLNDLISMSLIKNPTMEAAEAGLRSARESVKAQVGFYYPSVSGGLSANRQKVANSIAASSPLPSGASIFSLYTAQVGISYSPDIFGLNSRTVESLNAQAETLRYQMIASFLTLTTNVVTAAIMDASVREQISETNAIIEIERK